MTNENLSKIFFSLAMLFLGIGFGCIYGEKGYKQSKEETDKELVQIYNCIAAQNTMTYNILHEEVAILHYVEPHKAGHLVRGCPICYGRGTSVWGSKGYNKEVIRQQDQEIFEELNQGKK